jgi:hypothetical protein
VNSDGLAARGFAQQMMDEFMEAISSWLHAIRQQEQACFWVWL